MFCHVSCIVKVARKSCKVSAERKSEKKIISFWKHLNIKNVPYFVEKNMNEVK